MERLKTMSKHFYDDEILFKDPETGDIHLLIGVRRKTFDKTDEDLTSEEYINYEALQVSRLKEVSRRSEDYDYNIDQVDDWLTE